jgi:sugar O-acyltransferase (sialic acid O-acetyltransferase NeuD family)
MKKIVIFGNGEFAEISQYYFGKENIAHFCVDDENVKESHFKGTTLLSYSELLKLNKSEFDIFIALSYKKMNSVREAKYEVFKKLGFTFASFIHKNSYISNQASIGENCLILENQTIQKNVEIKNNVFLWSGNHIGHNSKIDNNTYISSGVTISGNVTIGKNCFFGVNSCTKEFITIGDGVLISMGATVLKNIKSYSVVLSPESKVYESTHPITKKILGKI